MDDEKNEGDEEGEKREKGKGKRREKEEMVRDFGGLSSSRREGTLMLCPFLFTAMMLH